MTTASEEAAGAVLYLARIYYTHITSSYTILFTSITQLYLHKLLWVTTASEAAGAVLYACAFFLSIWGPSTSGTEHTASMYAGRRHRRAVLLCTDRVSTRRLIAPVMTCVWP
jgi:hypothetical protein